MYVPAWSPLNPGVFLQRSRQRELLPYPLCADRSVSYYVARAGVYALCRALRSHGVDAVLVPDYHSSNEVSAIRAAGMHVVFYAIDRHLQPDVDQIRALVSEGRIGALYLIHYIGWPQPVEELQSLCRSKGVLLIEDCGLAFLSCKGGRPLGTFGDYAVFSFYKTLPVPNGGMLVQNAKYLNELNTSPARRCSTLSLVGRSMELMLSWVRLQSDSVGTMLCDLKGTIGRGLTAVNVHRTPVGDIGFEVADTNIGMSYVGRYLTQRFDYAGIVKQRRHNFLRLVDRLKGVVPLLREDLDEGVCPLFCPILVADKHTVAARLHVLGIEAVEFWNYGDSESESRSGEASRFLRRHVLDLPIHQDLSPERIDYIGDCVRAIVRRWI